ncbi:MAG: hypothetical protein WBM88_03715 [Woeseiaceae bacterium]
MLLLTSAAGLAAPLFDNDAVLEITLEGPLSTVIKDTKHRNEQRFSLTVQDSTIDVDVRVRGISRPQVCRFPPLRLDFRGGDTTDTVFSGQDKLKLVTHCIGGADYEQNVLEEYAAYRIFNVLSDVSFRTRLARIRYVDTDDPGGKDLVRHAFLIESDRALAERNGGSVVDTRRVTKNYLDESQTALAYIFQYLIGNTDWGLVRAIDEDTCCHNGLLVAIGERHFYVPYDFDRSGLVNARYARPDPSLRIKRVTQRAYRGYCMPGEAVREGLRVILDHHDDIIRVIRELPSLSEKDIESRTRFVDGFFEAAANEDKLLRRFESRCL